MDCLCEWLAETVSQEEAEAGTATDRRAWTAQRVKQAIDALGGGETLWEADGGTTIKPKLDKTVNHNKITGLGDAAIKDVGTGSGDVAAGDDGRFPTTDEKAALAGTGTPSVSNKYVTNDDDRFTSQITSLTLTQTSWTEGTTYWEYVLSNGSITANSIVEIIPDNADYEIIQAAIILPTVDSSAGSVKIYAVNEPADNIGVTINIKEKTT